MPTRRLIKGVLANFLGTYASRYSAHGGYLLFGYLVDDLRELRINLLGQEVSDPSSPTGVAILRAITRFEDLRRLAGLPLLWVREAWLTLRRLAGETWGSINGHSCAGYNISFSVLAVMDTGRRYERERVEFVAPHHLAVRFAQGEGPAIPEPHHRPFA
jgi:hypothetical protein